jgi:flagellar biosynthetic protein FliO
MEVMGQLAGVGAVLALLAGTLWALRHRGFAAFRPRRGDGRLLRSLERLPLGPQHTLHLVSLGEETLVVASSPSGCTLLARLSGGAAGNRPEALS